MGRLKAEGSSKLQDVRGKIKKYGRRVLADLANLRAAQQAVRNASGEMQADIMPAMKNFYQPLKKALSKTEKANAGWAEKYKKEVAERKRLHNLVLELKGNIRVFCRVRPQLPHESGEGTEPAIFFPEDSRPDLEDGTIAVMDDSKGTEKVFEYDAIFGRESKQEEVFEEVEALVTSVMDGYNVCIFAYGQTGSGKTFTMEGSDTQQGINPRTLSRVFELVAEKKSDYAYSLEFTVLEIYNEDIKDLLDPKSGKKCEVRQGPDGNYVQDLTQFSVKSFDEVIGLWSKAKENRTTFSNNINEHSSRSHLVISLYVRGENLASGVQSYGKLHLVDLAGSERLSRTNATGDRLKEAQNINKSLSALGDVIAAAASKQGHIPYRNSKLTHVLQVCPLPPTPSGRRAAPRRAVGERAG
jgi:kinesin family protein C2/C3